MTISLVFSFCYLLILAVCIYVSWKRHWKKGAVSLGVVLFAFLAAYCLARAAVVTYGEQFFERFREELLTFLKLQNDAAMKGTQMLQAAALAASALMGMLVFWGAFLILWGLGSLLKRLLFSKITKVKYASYAPKNGLHWLGLLFGLGSFFLVSFLFLYPLGTVSEVACSAAGRCNEEISVPVLTNPIVRLYGGAGRSFFDQLTMQGDGSFRNSEEAEHGTAVCLAVKKIIDGEDKDDSGAECITEALNESKLLLNLASELVAEAADSWKNGQAFLTVTLELPQGRSRELVISVLEILSQWQKRNLIQDVNTAIRVYKLLQRQEILEISDGSALMEALSDEEFVKALFAELSANKDFVEMIPKVMRFGIASALDAMELPMKEEYLVEFNAGDLSQEEWQQEAKAFSVLINRMHLMVEDKENFDVLGFVQDLYQLRDSKVLGNLFINLLIQLITSIPGIG